MSDEFCAGVQILLKRMESNPDEFREEYGKWGSLINAVHVRIMGEDAMYIRALTDAEVEALYEGLTKIYRPVFDEWVMKQVFNDEEQAETSLQHAYQMAQGKRVAGSGFSPSFSDPRLYQNSVLGGSGGSVGGVYTTGISIQKATEQKAQALGLGHLLKKAYNKLKL